MLSLKSALGVIILLGMRH